MKPERLRPGMRIYSPEYGNGKIVNIRLSGDALVHFDREEKGYNFMISDSDAHDYRRLWRARKRGK